MALNCRTIMQMPLHKRCLIFLATGLAILTVRALVVYLTQAPQDVVHAVWGGSMAAFATALGALPVLFTQQPSQKTQDAVLGFGAGIMLAACAFSLILPGLRSATELGHGAWAAAGIMAASILLGAAVLLSVERALLQGRFIKSVEREKSDCLRRTWLLVFAVALHNLPEGLAIGIAFAGGFPGGGSALSVGIAIQDVPEGLIIALALLTAGYSRYTSVLLAAMSGLIEPLGALLGVSMVGYSIKLLPWGLGFAAGSMLFVVIHEIIPESHRAGHGRRATAGLVAGFVLMLVLDAVIGES